MKKIKLTFIILSSVFLLCSCNKSNMNEEIVKDSSFLDNTQNEDNISTIANDNENASIENKDNAKTVVCEFPYVGMPEYNIGRTSLGEPDNKEYSHNYYGMQERARWITYTWYDSKGVKKCEAKVSSWDGKNRTTVSPYVEYVDFWGELLYMNPSYN